MIALMCKISLYVTRDIIDHVFVLSKKVGIKSDTNVTLIPYKGKFFHNRSLVM